MQQESEMWRFVKYVLGAYVIFWLALKLGAWTTTSQEAGELPVVSWWCPVPLQELQKTSSIAVGRVAACPQFSTTTARDPMELIPLIPLLSEHQRWACSSDLRRLVAALQKAHPTEMCAEALLHRNGGVGLALDKAERAARSAVAPDERLLGLWVDVTHPCGVFALAERPDGHIVDFMACADGSSLRRPTALGVEPFKDAGAVRAWRTPGLTPQRFTMFGESGVEYFDRMGNRHDLHTYRELADGRLQVYSDGVGVSREDAAAPWSIAVPIDVVRRQTKRR